MSGGGKRYDAMAVRDYQQNGATRTAWTRIGAAFVNTNGSISIQLDALPVNGRVVLQVPLSPEEREQRSQGRQGGGGQQRGGGYGGQTGGGYQNNNRGQGGGQRGGGRHQQRGFGGVAQGVGRGAPRAPEPVPDFPEQAQGGGDGFPDDGGEMIYDENGQPLF